MSRARFLAVLLPALLMAVSASANRIDNGDFTLWADPGHPTSWTVEDTTKTKVEQCSDPTQSPPYSAKFTRLVDSTGNNKGLLQRVRAGADSAFTLEAWCQDTDDKVKGGVTITWRKQDTSFISNTGISYSDSGVGGWQRLVRSATAPAETYFADVIVRIYNVSGQTPAGGIVYFDDVAFDTGTGIAEGRPAPVPGAGIVSLSSSPSRGAPAVNLTLSAPGPVSLTVYDLTGTLVARPFAGRLSAGSHRIELDPDGSLTPGLYFLVADTGEARPAVRKILISW
jgi:hypothetical protein